MMDTGSAYAEGTALTELVGDTHRPTTEPEGRLTDDRPSSPPAARSSWRTEVSQRE